MGKKVREYKSGDFIFAKVKGYPAWPARVQRMNGKKYFVYFYGTGETANLPPNMIFDYAENKEKFLTKTPKRRDFNEGVKQIEYDFANNVPLEQVIGVPMEVPEANDSVNDSALGATYDGETTANETADETQIDTAMESDDAGNLVIDEEKTPGKGRKSKADTSKTVAKEPPKKEIRTPRGKPRKEGREEEEKREEKEKKEEEIVSRSGRKIRPKRYIDEETEDIPAPKKRRAASPVDKDKGKNDKCFTQYNAVKQSELEGLKTPFKSADEDKDNILIAYLSNGLYVGVKLFQCRPTAFKNDQSKLQWDKQAARNAITLKTQLERDQITPEAVQGQLVMHLNLTDEEKAALDKERDTEDKKARLAFLRTEMKLIDLDSKIKTCLCLEKADTEMCLSLLDELMGLFTALEVSPLMLLKHPTCLETVKRMRAYVGNTPSWDLSQKDALTFNKQAHRIRRKADTLYHTMKELFVVPEGLSFWEYFSERVVMFKKATANLTASELLEMVHEPLEMCQPSCLTLISGIDEANMAAPANKKNKTTPAKAKKAPVPPAKGKRQSTRKQQDNKDNIVAESKQTPEVDKEGAVPSDKETGTTPDDVDNDKDGDDLNGDNGDVDMLQEAPENAEDAKEDDAASEAEKSQDDGQKTPEKKNASDACKENDESEDAIDDKQANDDDKSPKSDKSPSKGDKSPNSDKSPKKDKKKDNSDDTNDGDKSKQCTNKNSKPKDAEKKDKKPEKSSKDGEKSSKDGDKSSKDVDKSSKDEDKSLKDGDKSSKEDEKSFKDTDKSAKDTEKSSKDIEKSSKDSEKSSKDDEVKDDKEGSGEGRAKRSRESKKTEPPPRSPAKRKPKN